MVLLSKQIASPNRKVMPGLQEHRSSSKEDLIEHEEIVLLDHNSGSSSLPSDRIEFNHPNVPDISQLEHENEGYTNHGFENDSSDNVLTEEAFKSPFPSSNVVSCLEELPDPSMSTEGIQRKVQTLSLPEEQQWMETERSAFITKKIQDIVQAFQYRAEKAKEKLVQPPTPSPSPPLETSSDNEPTPVHKPRPRLQSLIEDDKSSVDVRSLNVSMWCCTIKKKFIPVFPTIIDPQSKLYISWLFLVMLSYAYNAWSIILLSVFPYQTPENIPIFLAFDYTADIIYLLDIALFKVRLQFLHDGFWVEDYKRTKANYFRKREFKLDLLSLLPLDLLYFVYGVNPLFRLPRFLKVQTFWEFFNRVDAVTKTPYVIRIIRTLMYMMYLIHLNACAYYAMSTWEGIRSNRWVFQGEGNAYIRCFYFATKTATSIGKNPKPENEIEYIFMTISWLMGVFIFAFLVGQIRDIVATATQGRTQYRQLMDQTVMYMRNLNLPDELQKRVRMWLNHNWEQQKTFDVSKILNTLPRKMKTDIAINVHYKTLVKVQLFKDCDKALLRDLVLQLKPVLFLPGDYICKKGEVGKEMYIVNKGMVEVLGGDQGELVLATLTKGCVFGEISLLGIPGCSRRTADVRSKGFSNLFVLGKDDLWEALKNYPEAQKVLKKKAKNIIKENEARAKANKPNMEEVPKTNDLKKEEVAPSSTPRLVKTVMQLLPKSSHRIQPQSNCFVSSSFLNKSEDLKVKNSPFRNQSRENFFQNRSSSTTDHIKKSTVPENSKNVVKLRSMSDGTLRNKKPFCDLSDPYRSKRETPSPLTPLLRASTAKSEPCTYHHPNSTDNGQITLRKVLNPPKSARNASKKSMTHLSLNQFRQKSYERLSWPSEQSLVHRRVNNFHGDTSESENSSELFSTSSQRMSVNSSDEGKFSLDWTSNSTSIPFLGDLFHQSGDSQASVSINRTFSQLSTDIFAQSQSRDSQESLNSAQNLPTDNSKSSSSTSIPCLSNLFRSSSQSPNHDKKDTPPSPNHDKKDIPLSPIIKHEVSGLIHRSGSSTSGSSSVGYDNLAFVPTGILSRRSSIFSDISG